MLLSPCKHLLVVKLAYMRVKVCQRVMLVLQFIRQPGAGGWGGNREPGAGAAAGRGLGGSWAGLGGSWAGLGGSWAGPG